jgi:hypothetical protein
MSRPSNDSPYPGGTQSGAGAFGFGAGGVSNRADFNTAGRAAAANTGNGGEGAAAANSFRDGGNGGSGYCIINWWE